MSRNSRYVVALAAGVMLMGTIALWKQALIRRPQGDFGVFARAGWAVRQGDASLYHVQDDNTWHYNYPPTFALLLPPFADPPKRDIALVTAHALGHAGSPLHTICAFNACPNPMKLDDRRYLPYWLSCALFYLINVALLFVAVHLLVGAVERRVPAARSADEANRRWWWWRVGPVLACAPAVGLNLMRGQVQVIMLALIVGMLVCLMSDRRFWAGVCLSGAIIIKLFPAYLLLIPLVRRDGRFFVGCAAGLLVGLVVIPFVAFGPEQATVLYADFGKLMLGPALGYGVDPDRADELLNTSATHSQSFLVVMHKTMHLGVEKIPPEAARWVKVTHLLIGGSMTLALLWRGNLRRAEGLALAGQVGLLTTLMILVCPICHLHYFTLAIPMVAAMLIHREVTRPAGPNRDMWRMAYFLVGAMTLPMIPGFGILRNVGVPMFAVLWWWFAGLATRWEEKAAVAPTARLAA